MKKILPCSIFLLFSFQASAQTIFSEDFEYQGQIPNSWTAQNTDYFSGWIIGFPLQLSWDASTLLYHSYTMYVADQGCGCDNPDELLYTPSIDLSSLTNAFLTFDSYFYKKTNQNFTESARVEISTDGGATWSLLKELDANQEAWERKVVDLSAYAGMNNIYIGFRYSDNGGDLHGWAIDNVEVSAVPAGTDVALSSVTIGKWDPAPSFVSFPKYFTGLPLTNKITVRNIALEPVTSFDVTVDDGANIYTETINGINILPLEDYSFFTTQSYNTLSGPHTITITASNVNNGSVEIDTSNNAVSADVEGMNPNKDKIYFAEEGTGTWCGWCPRGAVYLDYMTTTYPDQFAGVAVHTSDPMTVTAYDQGLGLNAFPSVRIDRTVTIDPLELEGDFIERITQQPAVKLTGTALYNMNSNVLTINLHGAFLQSLNGDYRFNAVIAEDSVHGPSPSYDQSNDYSDNLAGPMGGFENLPYPVPASQMNYNHVARALLDGFMGTAGSLPASITAGSSYDYNYTYTIPPAWNIDHIYVVGMVIQHSDSEVLNVVRLPITIAVATDEVTASYNSLSIYPNPVNDVAQLKLALPYSQRVSLKVLNELGDEVYSGNNEALSGNQALQLDTRYYAPGVYTVTVITSNEVLTGRLVVAK